ncbi:retrovirus-related Pol polyprotein from transposon 297 [Trichonephila clavipes]|nr:retrovirus-related Pol polyprotein from transposon 297 [Trichonephila clavipes]
MDTTAQRVLLLTSDIVKAPSHGNADALSRRPCPENCRHCSRVELHRYNVGALFEQSTRLGPESSSLLLAYRRRRSRDYRIFTIPDAFCPGSSSPCDCCLVALRIHPSSPEEYVQNLQARFEDVHNLARERINLRTEKMKTRYDTKATGHQFKEGDKLAEGHSIPICFSTNAGGKCFALEITGAISPTGSKILANSRQDVSL